MCMLNSAHLYRSYNLNWSLLHRCILPMHAEGGPKVKFSQVYVHSNLLKIIHQATKTSHIWSLCALIYNKG